jgi:ubiquitin C-terminal hydrolase
MRNLSLAKCMNEFTKEEILDGMDTMYCSKCKDHRPTKKTLVVYTTPEVTSPLLDSCDPVKTIF